MRFKQPIWTRFLPSSLVVNVATLGPIGLRLPAPGTWGSLAGLLYFTAVFAFQGPIGYTLLCLVSLYLAVAFCGEAEFRLGRSDPGQVILDEVVALPLCLIGWTRLVHVAPPWLVFLSAFALFRFFDILKPLGIRQLQRLPGGWGVVADDVAAALATCVSLHLLAWWWQSRG